MGGKEEGGRGGGEEREREREREREGEGGREKETLNIIFMLSSTKVIILRHKHLKIKNLAQKSILFTKDWMNTHPSTESTM